MVYRCYSCVIAQDCECVSVVCTFLQWDWESGLFVESYWDVFWTVEVYALVVVLAGTRAVSSNEVGKFPVTVDFWVSFVVMSEIEGIVYGIDAVDAISAQ